MRRVSILGALTMAISLTALADVLIDRRRRTCSRGTVGTGHAQVPTRSTVIIPIHPPRQARKVAGTGARAAERPREVYTAGGKLRCEVVKCVAHSAERWHPPASARSARDAARAAKEAHALPGM